MSRGGLLAIVIGIIAAGGLFAAVAGPSAGDSASDGDIVAADNPTTTASTTTASTTTASTTAASASDAAPTIELATPAPEEAPPMLGQAGTLEDLDGWLQTDATSLADFDGSVKIVQFWTFGCRNCKATIPHLAEIYADYSSQGLEIIGVHAPEFEFESDPAAIAQAAVDLGVTWPIALDTDKTNFRSWQPGRRFWPRTFVVDQNNEIRFDRIGEGAYDELHDTVVWLLENGP
jgi:thiol-disulfide isomerase/thioredoxin